MYRSIRSKTLTRPIKASKNENNKIRQWLIFIQPTNKKPSILKIYKLKFIINVKKETNKNEAT